MLLPPLSLVSFSVLVLTAVDALVTLGTINELTALTDECRLSIDDSSRGGEIGAFGDVSRMEHHQSVMLHDDEQAEFEVTTPESGSPGRKDEIEIVSMRIT